jgi:hypothetical protein
LCVCVFVSGDRVAAGSGTGPDRNGIYFFYTYGYLPVTPQFISVSTSLLLPHTTTHVVKNGELLWAWAR